MGLGMTAQLRSEATEGCSKPTLDKHKGVQKVGEEVYDAVVVDMPAFARSKNFGALEQSALSFAAQLCRTLWKSFGGLGGYLLLMFDTSGHRLHPQRRVLRSRRYRRLSPEELAACEARGMEVVGGRPYHAGQAPYTREELAKIDSGTSVNWQRLWDSSEGKDLAWSLLRDAMLRTHARMYGGRQLSVVTVLNGEDKVWPPAHFRDGLPGAEVRRRVSEGHWCEADHFTSEAVRVLRDLGAAKKILVRTIDTDMIVQLLCCGPWPSFTTLDVQLKRERIDMLKLYRKYGGTPSSCASAAFWLLQCGGSDYCRPLTHFGVPAREVLKIARDPRSRVVSRGDRGMSVSGSHIGAILARSMHKNRKDMPTLSEFNDHVNSVCFCLAYYSNYKKLKEPYGGPDVPHFDWLTCGIDGDKAYSRAHCEEILSKETNLNLSIIK
jgi:hypothetical protein